MNANHLDTDKIKETFEAAGYYRVDVSGVTVLALNSMYMDYKSTETYAGEDN